MTASSLHNKHIVLGVTGSIAAYKSADLVRRLRETGARVRVVLTAGGAKFITPLTLQSLSGHPVQQDLLDADSEAMFGHIELARWADAVLIAPASANALARFAQGRADDLLAAVCLATTAPIIIAPAMNHRMWGHAATKENIAKLTARGVAVVGPDSGEQACGEFGPGRMAEPSAIVSFVASRFEPGTLTGKRVLITSGPTQEAIDPVRFVGNRSSGKMGFAVARAALEAGADVTLISGPVSLETPEGVDRINVRTAQEMFDAVMRRIGKCDIFVGTAAVADYRPAQSVPQKIKKKDERLSIELVRNPDILASVGALASKPFVVGFAAETENLEANARAKLETKKLDLVAANWVGPQQGFESDENALLLLWQGGRKEIDLDSKDRVARQLVTVIAERLNARAVR
jgi:phosphopantothenoylcysteine decarboxylase/phosphopantothenate--cysteine ligase